MMISPLGGAIPTMPTSNTSSTTLAPRDTQYIQSTPLILPPFVCAAYFEEKRPKRKKWEPLVKALTLCNLTLLFQIASHAVLCAAYCSALCRTIRFALLCFATCTVSAEYVPVKKYVEPLKCLNFNFSRCDSILAPALVS